MSDDKKKVKKEKDKDKEKKTKKDDSKTDKKKTVVKKKSDKDSKEKKEKDAKTPKKDNKEKDKDKDKPKQAKKKGPAQILKKDYNKWQDTAEETASLEWKSVDESENVIVMAFGKYEFNVTYPATYPECDVNFFVFSTAEGMDQWNDEMQTVCEKKSK